MTQLRRRPVVTIVVFVISTAVTIAQFFDAAVLHDLERTPAGLHGDWWRTLTSLLVQDGGVAGAVSNLGFLLLLGIAAEQVANRWQWIVAYLGAGLVGEFAGYAWQPTGGGNSVANCGLAGLLVVAVVRQRKGMPAFGPFIAALWIGALLATWSFPLILVGIVAALASQRIDWSRAAFRYAFGAYAVVAGAVLVAVANIHGAALLAALVIAWILFAAVPAVPQTRMPQTRMPETRMPG
jgi:membrane associated rhomboid family serine protease